jgi:multidrug resistance efflux pump
MFELMFCSLLTILPDYLYRRYAQGKRFGKEITFFSIWYELRWGITGCLMLTVSLITMIFYFHPSAESATLYYRTVPIVPVGVAGRVAEVNVGFSAAVKQGDVLFRLDSAKQDAALETAKRKSAEVDASLISARADVVKAEAQVGEAQASLQQAKDELDVKSELQKRNPGIVPQRDIEKLQVLVDQRQSGVDSANASKESALLRVSTLLPAQKASAEAALAEAQVEVDRTTIRAGFDGRVEQFLLRTGDVVNPYGRRES